MGRRLRDHVVGGGEGVGELSEELAEHAVGVRRLRDRRARAALIGGAGRGNPSPVPLAMGCDPDTARKAIRFTWAPP